MTREEAISWLVSLTEHEGEDIPIYDNDVEALDMAITTMRKYQKIKEIYDNWNVDFGVETHRAMSQIGEVLNGDTD